MKKKTIKKILDSKFDSFVNSIDDNSVKDLVKNNTIITGGCIASMFLKEDVNDYDMYFRNFVTVKAVAEYYVKKFKSNKAKHKEMLVTDEDGRVRIMIKSSGVESETTNNDEYQYFEQLDPGDPSQDEFINNALEFDKDRKTSKKGEYKPIFLTSNAITLSNDVQLILRFYGEPEDIHKNFDYVHCTNYYVSWNKELITRPRALECLLAKELIYGGSLYPICSVIRMKKFLKRGWSITAGEIFKMVWQISKLNLNSPEELSEQLLGVDVSYFYQLIELLKKAEKENIDIDYAYICKLVDEVF